MNTNRTLILHSIYDESSFQKLFIKGFNILCNKPKHLKKRNNEQTLSLHIKFSIGFDLKESKLLSLNHFDYFDVRVVVLASNLDFYARKSDGKYKLVNMSSSLDLIASYHNLTLSQIDESNKKNVLYLYNSFKSIFSELNVGLLLTTRMKIRTKLSRLLFKDANFKQLRIYKLTNTSIRRHLFEIVQDDDLFHFITKKIDHIQKIHHNMRGERTLLLIQTFRVSI